MNAEEFKSIQDAISACLVDTTRTAGQIAAQDLAFQRSSNPSIAHLLDGQNARLLTLAQKLISNATSGSALSVPRLSDVDTVDEHWRGVVDVVDNLLEKADACLDEYTGVIKRLSPSRREESTTRPAFRKPRPGLAYQDKDLPKPQLLFNSITTNDEVTAFKPLLRTKPHAVVPLDDSLGPIFSEDGFKQYKHPYEAEIIQSSYPSSVYVKADPIPYHPFDSTKAVFVDTFEGVMSMLAELKSAKEIAVDLEHHDTHSYIGLVSLMQISTRDKDWVVDTLKPWREDLQILNEVFADPKILKIFHGATSDMVWLQRDLGLYVVGLFDTYHASHSLSYQKHSLASLLTKFANFDAQKKYQTADWRIRPLPEEMFKYARSDTHFLLYVYDNMRNELVDRSKYGQPDGNLIDVVLENSKKESLQRYERPFYDAERGTGSNGWYNMLMRTPGLFTREQFAVFRATHQWRDNLARQEDESVHVIMPKAVLFNIARDMPMDMLTLLGCSRPVSEPLRLHVEELLELIKSAKARGREGPDLKEFMKFHPPNIEPATGSTFQDRNQPAPNPLSTHVSHPIQIGPADTSVQSSTSRFWGTTVGAKLLRHPNEKGSGQLMRDMRLAIPLPQLSAEVIHSVSSGSEEKIAMPLTQSSTAAEHQYTKDRKPVEKSIFVIKELGGSRKRKAAALGDDHDPVSSMPAGWEGNSVPASTGLEDGMDTSPYSGTTEQAAIQKAEQKAERKAERKAQEKCERAQRKRQEAQQINGLDENGEHVEEEAFDYGSAPSILHAARDTHDRAGSKKAFDPYTKSLDAPKGMRKSKKEIAGKSFTFKS